MTLLASINNLILAPPSVPSIPRIPSIPRPSVSRPTVIINNNRPRPPVVINNHYYGGGYGGGYYHPWYHPVFVWPTYGNYSTGAVGGVETGLLSLLVLVLLVGAIVAGWRAFK
jgi:hypothetical protein